MVDTTKIEHPFMQNTGKPSCIVAVTSDVGLLGGLNMQVIMNALNEFDKDHGKLIIIGERGHAYLRDKKVPFVAFPGIKDEERFGQAMQLRDYTVKFVLTGAAGSVKVIYPRPISFTVQHVEMAMLLPYTKPPIAADAPAKEIIPLDKIIMESSPSEIVEYLLYMWSGHKFFEILGWSRLAELSARYVHLENSSQRIQDVDRQLRLQYFRAKHELIDRSMRELFSARSIYGNK